MRENATDFRIPIVLVLMLSFISFNIYSQPNWSYTNTSINHTVLLPAAAITIVGGPVEAGDFIGAFYTDGTTLVCAGYAEWPNNTYISAVSVWGDDPMSSNKDGFDVGEEFKWKVYDASQGVVIDAYATYDMNMPNGGNYITNGQSGLLSLMTFGGIIPNVTNTSCNGGSDGYIEIYVAFGTGPYTFNWSTGASTQNIYNLSSGAYTVVATDIYGVSEMLTVSVGQPFELVLNMLVNESNASICQAHAQVFPFGGSGLFSYLWNDPSSQTNSVAEGLCPGTYGVTVTDSNGCLADTSIIIQVNSATVTDSAFTFFDTCMITTIPDTAYISDLYFTASTMEIEWTIQEGGLLHVINTTYASITTPGVYYVGLVINCPNKFLEKMSFVAVVEITNSMLSAPIINNELSIKIFPNPIEKDLNILFNNFKGENFTVEVYNTIGSIVYQRIIERDGGDDIRVILPEINPGIYFAKIYNEYNQKRVIKFIK